MRRLVKLAAAVVFACVATLTASAEEKNIEAPIKKVTVYPDWAQVSRVAEVELPSGECTLVMDDLPGGVIDASLRASVAGVEGITLQRLSHSRKQHLKSQQQQLADLEAEVTDLERHRKQVVSDRFETLNQLKKFVTALGESVTKEPSDEKANRKIEVADWATAYNFIGIRSFNLADSIRQTRQELEDIDAQVALLRSNLRDLSRGDQRVTKSVRIDVKLERAGMVRMTLVYIIPGARWTPMYDARIHDDPSQVEFTCHAEVSQNTGEDWKEVELTLSTARPSLGAGPGDLKPWLLAELPPLAGTNGAITVLGNQDVLDKFMVPSQVEIQGEPIRTRPVPTVENLLEQVAGVRTTAEREVFMRGGRGDEAAYVVAGAAPPSTTVSGTGPFPTVFKIKRVESISTGGEAARVTVAEWNFQGRTRLTSRPRLTPAVFRLVTVTNQGEIPLLPGDLSVFAGPNFLGRTRIDQNIAPSEEFELPFGPDDHVTVERKMVAVKKTQKGNKVRLEQTVRIILQNHGPEVRSVGLEELRPISQDNRISVRIGPVTPPPISQDEDGLIKWEVSLGPGAEVVVDVPYEINYPSDLRIIGL